MTAPAERKRQQRTPRSRETARTPEAQEQWRREVVDELVQHPDVFRYLADQADGLAREFPLDAREHLTLRMLAQSSREVALMLERAELVRAS